MGVDGFDAQLSSRPSELGSSLGISIPGVNAEDAVFIAIQRHRHTVRYDVVVQHAHVAQRGLGRHEAQPGECAAGVVDEYQQGFD